MIDLKLIKNSKDSDLLLGMNILNKYIPSNLNINSNELVYWIDNYNKKFNDKLYCYIIKYNNIVIGWFQFTHFIDKFIFIDYFIVEKQYRTNEIMKNIYNLIKNEFNKTKCDSIILECGLEMNQHDAIIKLYKKFGFDIFNINYLEPSIDVNLYQQKIDWIAIPSVLMYYNKKLSLLEIVKTIYFNHYLRWYSLYEFDLTDYRTFLNNIINKYEKH